MRLRLLFPWVACFFVGCSSGGNSPPKADTSDAAAQALMRSVAIKGGAIKPGGLPDASNQIVTLNPQPTDPMVPGSSVLMPLDVDNPDEAKNAGKTVLMQFGGASDHFEVPVGADTGGPAQLQLQVSVKSDACDQLCNKMFTIALAEAMALDDGSVSKHAMQDVQLDCRKKGDEARCGSSAGGSTKGASKDAGASSSAGGKKVDDAGSVSTGLGDAGAPSFDAAVLPGAGFDAAGLFSADGGALPPLPPYKCADGSQVPITSVCNGVADCADGSDERACPDASSAAFACPSTGQVLAPAELCNGVKDCSDGFDELICIPCTDGMGSYSVLQRCDGKAQCADGSDEMGCDFTCTSGESVPVTKVCDGVSDCMDGSDEAPCQFPCGDGTTVSNTKLCDGVMDCKNGADEAKPMCP